MNALAEAHSLIEGDPGTWRAHVLAQLLREIETGRPVSTHLMYQLPHPDFRLAVRCMHQWRMDQAASCAGVPA